ncbi:histone H4 acetyltransferase, NuA4 complex, Eaf6 [Stachybotrys elegans]|uniref:Chromatin modification-related protein EAF6 n=1 Tax=Stachybotrys elegans TaxID=80388 RepID=A0A8K0SSS5_9HYPO|nr:histone H4 acetyltransferase, NuA4 complex, Eaf6 [Stachybotrys elegans]
MADKATGAPTGEPQPTLAEYKKSQARVRELVEKRRLLERRLAQVEDSIATKETAYLDSTPSGNIITGFDNYMKGTSGAAAQRRKAGTTEQNRVFSRSSISYRPNNGDSASGGSTPGSHAPTPISTSFRDTGSNNATPTSATAGKNANKLKKKDNEDSEGDSQTVKKRTNFGASRK